MTMPTEQALGLRSRPLDMEIEATNRKAVNAGALSAVLTTFDDLYLEATPEEQCELIQLRVNQLVWTPDEIRLSLLDGEDTAVTAVQCKASYGSPYGIRTRATAVRGRRPRPLDERATNSISDSGWTSESTSCPATVNPSSSRCGQGR